MRRFYTCALLLALLTFGAIGIGNLVHAQGGEPPRRAPVLTLTDQQTAFNLAPYIELLRDPTRALTLRDVSSPPFSDRFSQNLQGVPNLGITNDAVWARWRVRNDSSTDEWRLALDEPRLGSVSFYLPSTDIEFVEKASGRDLPFNARELPYRPFVFGLDLPRTSERTYYLQLKSASPLVFPITISTADAFAQKEQQNLLFFGLFYGAMLIMAGYNLFLFFSLRDPNYLYLALFIVTYSLSAAVRQGLASQYLWPSLPNPFFVQAFTALALIFQIKFTTGILETRARLPGLHRIFDGLVIATLVVTGFSLFVSVNAVLNLVTALTLASEGVAVFAVLRQGYRAARLYLVSWVLFLFSALAFVFSNLNLLSALVIPETVVIIATAVGALFWSLAIADRVNLLKAETESANGQLTLTNRRLERSERKYRSLFENSRDAIFMTTREGKLVDLNPAGIDLFGLKPTDLDAIDVRDVYVDEAERQNTLVAMQEQGFVKDFPVHLRRSDGSPMNALITSSIWQDDERNEPGFQGIVRDVTERLKIEAELEQHRHHLEELVMIRTAEAAAELTERRRAQQALNRRILELSTLNDIAVSVGAFADIRLTLENVGRLVAGLYAATAAIILVLDRKQSQLQVVASDSRSPQPELEQGRVFDLEGNPAFRMVIDQSDPIRIEEPGNSPLLAGMRELLQSLNTYRLLLVPLRVHGEVIGVLTIHRGQEGTPFTADEMSLGETIATAIATALENVRLYEQAQVLAIEQERHRVARDLHDSVIQTLYSTVLMASGWRMLAEHGRLDSNGAAAHFQQVADQCEMALKEMRLLLFQLRPPVLGAVGLAGALEQRLDAVERRLGVQAGFVTIGEWDGLAPRLEQELYYIAQEALNNSLHHANAKNVLVRLERIDGVLELTIEDNGSGFDTELASGGMGLANMRERAHEIGAEFTVESDAREGSKIRVRIELEPIAR